MDIIPKLGEKLPTVVNFQQRVYRAFLEFYGERWLFISLRDALFLPGMCPVRKYGVTIRADRRESWTLPPGGGRPQCVGTLSYQSHLITY